MISVIHHHGSFIENPSELGRNAVGLKNVDGWKPASCLPWFRCNRYSRDIMSRSTIWKFILLRNWCYNGTSVIAVSLLSGLVFGFLMKSNVGCFCGFPESVNCHLHCIGARWFLFSSEALTLFVNYSNCDNFCKKKI